ncbi:MAG: efflux RND transporter periplasmic adaptor subunit [Phycisphaerae bacterium]|nr:efflux RND transporter periplasmic adaptor subunit [Phycisphaerae bacterium]
MHAIRVTRWAGIAVSIACTTSAFGQEPPATRVAVLPAEMREVSQTVPVVGTVLPMRRSVLGAQIAGLVQELLVEEGDRVEQNQVVCTLRDTTTRLELERAKATLASLDAYLAELEAGTRAEELRRIKAQAEEAKAMLTKWQLERQRIAELERQGVATMKEINDTQADLLAAEQRYEQAVALRDEAVAGPRAEVVLRARHVAEAQRVDAARLEDELGKTRIRAPFTGYVTAKHTEVGEWIQTGGPVVEVVELDSVKVRFDVPESAVSYAQIGRPVPIRIDALNETFTGTIRLVVPQANEAARTFPVDVEIPNSDHKLRAGMFARAAAPAGTTAQQLVVHKDAVIRRGHVALVVMIIPSPQGMMAMPVPVEVGADDGGWVAVVAESLQPGMPVAVKGHERIFFPSPVMIVPVEQIQAAPPPSSAATTQPASPPAAL